MLDVINSDKGPDKWCECKCSRTLGCLKSTSSSNKSLSVRCFHQGPKTKLPHTGNFPELLEQ
jgi:hypothetical protein